MIKEVKRYTVNGKTYTFDVSYEEMTRCGMMWLGVCRENGKEAWLDADGVQFIGERRQSAFEVVYNNFSSVVPYGCHYWGGEIRNNKQWRKQW